MALFGSAARQHSVSNSILKHASGYSIYSLEFSGWSPRILQWSRWLDSVSGVWRRSWRWATRRVGKPQQRDGSCRVWSGPLPHIEPAVRPGSQRAATGQKRECWPKMAAKSGHKLAQGCQKEPCRPRALPASLRFMGFAGSLTVDGFRGGLHAVDARLAEIADRHDQEPRTIWAYTHEGS